MNNFIIISPSTNRKSKRSHVNTMTKQVFEFKQKYYLAALVARNFNIMKTANEIRANRSDIRTHVGNKKKSIELAKKYGLL